MRVHLLNGRSFRARCFDYPLIVYRGALRRAGFAIKRFYHDTPRLYDCDLLIVSGDHVTPTVMHREEARVAAWVAQARDRVPALIWADTEDGPGRVALQVMALVEVYAKKQLYIDRALYRQPARGKNYHLEYFHQHADQVGEPDAKAGVQRALTDAEINKLTLSWHIGMGDYRTWGGYGRRFRTHMPFGTYPLSFAPAQRPRDVDVALRIQTRYVDAGLTLHRVEVERATQAFADAHPSARVVMGGKIDFPTYMNELARARVGVSPFGWGEICWRDSEVWLSGAALLKPCMDHLEMFPEVYHADETYLAHAWDLSDYDAVLAQTLADPAGTARIAAQGQAHYARVTADGSAAFVEHFAALIARARGGST